ncbi:MAG: DUF234 domain-containing protein [Euryarchaeota archaeon]|nr:DUF234 domain-containing protein [Euryarchaeota archaeon]
MQTGSTWKRWWHKDKEIDIVGLNEQNIYMYLAGNEKPDFWTLCKFRSDKTKANASNGNTLNKADIC